MRAGTNELKVGKWKVESWGNKSGVRLFSIRRIEGKDMLKVLLITVILVAIAFAGLGIRLLLDRKAEFSGGSCQSGSDALAEKGIGCGCGAGHCASSEEGSS